MFGALRPFEDSGFSAGLAGSVGIPTATSSLWGLVGWAGLAGSTTGLSFASSATICAFQYAYQIAFSFPAIAFLAACRSLAATAFSRFSVIFF